VEKQEQPTCGKGLAENSVLPARLGSLLGAMAENLEVHRKALDLTDQNSRAEYDAYGELIKELQQVAGQLEATANQMAGYRDLPMGKHDEQEMTHPRVRETFEKFVQQKQELLSLLEQTAERDNKLLETMRSQSR
jgi:formiminotetrahydrofolate cyclodeaminase